MKLVYRFGFVAVVGFSLLLPSFAYAIVGATPLPFPNASRAYSEADKVIEVKIVSSTSEEKRSILGDYVVMQVQWEILHVYKGQSVDSSKIETLSISTHGLCEVFSGTGGLAAAGGGIFDCAQYLNDVGENRLVYLDSRDGIHLVLPTENFYWYKWYALFMQYYIYPLFFIIIAGVAIGVIAVKRNMTKKKLSQNKNANESKESPRL
ncbi:MAG: hypothetical protein WCV85_02460 [Patescibacteria group bacterium]|jgi:hypothetical protein